MAPDGGRHGRADPYVLPHVAKTSRRRHLPREKSFSYIVVLSFRLDLKISKSMFYHQNSSRVVVVREFFKQNCCFGFLLTLARRLSKVEISSTFHMNKICSNWRNDMLHTHETYIFRYIYIL